MAQRVPHSAWPLVAMVVHHFKRHASGLLPAAIVTIAFFTMVGWEPLKFGDDTSQSTGKQLLQRVMLQTLVDAEMKSCSPCWVLVL